MIMGYIVFVFFVTDAVVLVIEISSGPVFLSSLRCTEEDQSLLDDCVHTQLGLAECNLDYRSGAKCHGKIYTTIIRRLL